MTAGLLGGAALLLVIAGAAKVVNPRRTAGALSALGWPSSPWLVRLGALAEVVLGAAALSDGPNRLLALLVAVSYLGFALFVMAALRAQTPIGTCGCFGQADTPPTPGHVVIDGLLAAGALWAAATEAPPLLDANFLAWVVAVVVVGWVYQSFR